MAETLVLIAEHADGSRHCLGGYPNTPRGQADSDKAAFRAMERPEVLTVQRELQHQHEPRRRSYR